MCSTERDAATIHFTQPRAEHVLLSTVYPVATPETTRSRRTRREMVQSPSVPDGWTDSAVPRDGLRQVSEVHSVLRDGQMDGSDNSRGGFSTSGQYFSNVAVQKELMDATEEVKNQSLKKVVMGATSASHDGLQMPQSLPSDAQLLCWTLVDDGVLPDGYCTYFADLMDPAESAAARQGDLPGQSSSGPLLHKFHQNKSQVQS